MSTIQEDQTLEYIRRIAEALERLVELAEPTKLLEPTPQESRTTITCTDCGKYISENGKPKETPQFVRTNDLISTRCRECAPHMWRH